ncbi:peptidase S8/S53 domain-containing protein [Lasiosphaeria hispida]|uniref:Peptidase S8/S53 domain-containing protein n=1 Tax=Lasiosphaeria hispida TaxID=260671 RepID=A0AAJ0HGW9_9PEZI|nr:peptidase S8/S53 domain-containing protein [Lasiosphaeria hispida]
MTTITINGNSLDPQAPTVTLRAFGLVQETAKDSDYILIQTNCPLTKDVKKQLADNQVELQEKVSEDAYLCAYKPEDLSEVRDLPFVAYANVYQPHFVIESRLKTVPAASSPTHPLLPAPARTEHTVEVDVEFHQDVHVTETPGLIEALAAAAHLDAETLETDGDKVRITVQHRYLADVAALDQVKSIHQVHAVKLHNNVARNVLHLDKVAHPVQATQYEGEGQLVCVSDTGFDKGTLNPDDVRDAFKTNSTVRVKALYGLGRTGNASDPDGHGTHVCGSVLGDETSKTTGERVQGTAPKATLVMQSLLDRRGGLGGIPSDLRELFGTPYTEHGVRIHTNSWGSSPKPFRQIEYNSESKEIDDFVDKHRDMVILFAAGNDGMDAAPRDGQVDRAQVGSQAAAKNCITVGASESVRPEINVRYSQFGYPKQPLGSDQVANNAQGMAAFSSRGPTFEGRIKPDIVAPGTCILSTLSSRATDTKDWGSSADPKFMFSGGTSMATPLVAGCCAVLRETLVKNGTPTPSAALIKALLINGAVELAGQYTPTEAGTSPNDSSGWGRVDVANSVVIPQSASGIKSTADQTAGFIDEDQVLDTSSSRPPTLKVTLVWTDPAGEQLQNDLDLIVVAPGGETERHGNQRAREFAFKTKEPYDRKNNVEQVVWEGIGKGEVGVVVRAHNVSSLKGQTFALAWKVY